MAFGVGPLVYRVDYLNTTNQYVEADLSMREKALGNIEEPDTKLKRFRASDSLMKFLEAL